MWFKGCRLLSVVWVLGVCIGVVIIFGVMVLIVILCGVSLSVSVCVVWLMLFLRVIVSNVGILLCGWSVSEVVMLMILLCLCLFMCLVVFCDRYSMFFRLVEICFFILFGVNWINGLVVKMLVLLISILILLNLVIVCVKMLCVDFGCLILFVMFRKWLFVFRCLVVVCRCLMEWFVLIML